MLNQNAIEGFFHRLEELGAVSSIATKMAHEKRLICDSQRADQPPSKEGD